MNYLDELYLDARFKFKRFIAEFENDNRGVSNIVATVILIVIVVLLAAALWGFLSGFFNEMFEKIKGAFNPSSSEINTGY